LLGFKPMDAVKWHYNIRHAMFIYPDEETISGSTSLFTHLLERLFVAKKVAICRLIPRKNGQPRLVALIPQWNELDIPDGFHVIPLPFADDKRKIPAPTLADG
jgi:ATP-dependent DNA helicase 2 subunit 1